MVPIRPRGPSGVLGLDWVTTDDGSLTLFDIELQETFHSGCGAVAESLVVYLFNSGVFGRIAGREPTRVFELGLGTCTNLLVTAALAEHFQVPLDYWCVENRPLPASVIRNLRLDNHLPQAILINFPADGQTADQRKTRQSPSRLLPVPGAPLPLPDYFLTILPMAVSLAECLDQLFLGTVSAPHPPPVPAQPASGCQFAPFQYCSVRLLNFTTLHLLVGNAEAFPELCRQDTFRQQFAAVYFDPFGPETTPELWSRDLLNAMYRILDTGGSLCSYCVKSRIRRELQEIGFRVDRVPGPVGGKREVLVCLK